MSIINNPLMKRYGILKQRGDGRYLAKIKIVIGECLPCNIGTNAARRAFQRISDFSHSVVA